MNIFTLYYYTTLFMLQRLLIQTVWILLVSFTPLPAQQNADSRRVDSLKQLVSKAPNDTAKARKLMELSMALLYNQPRESEQHTAEALNLFRQKGHYEGESHALNLNGLLQFRKGDAAAALEHYMSSYQLAKKHDLPQRMAKALNNMGIVYLQVKDYDRALAIYQEAFEINKALNNTEEMGSNLANCGIAMANKGKLDSALVFYHQALSRFLEINMGRGIANMHNNIGNIHLRQAHHEEALFYFKKALQFYLNDRNELYASSAYNNIGKVYLLQNRLDSAYVNLTKGLQLAETQNAKEELVESHLALSGFFEKTGKEDQSLFHLKRYLAYRDSLSNSEKTAELTQVTQRFEVQKQLELINKENELQTARSWAWILALAGIILMVTLGSITFNISLTRNSVRRKLYEEEKARFQAEKDATQLREVQYTYEIDLKNRELASTAVNIIQKNDLLHQITENLEQLKKNTQEESMRKELSRLTRLIENGLNQEQEWENFRLHFNGVHPGFFDRLLASQPKLTPKDLRICAYLRMNLSTKEIASLLNFSIRGVETIRYRLRKKLDLPADVDLNQWMMQR